ncbi:MAG: TraR/DksA C4-type zinc finger protein [Gammaproteobacteria bacterium]|nr:TraR/DksA C4-type zinc finger protein [Gammaproteobacteria bacterium]
MANEGDMAQAVIERDEEIRNKIIEFERNKPKNFSQFCIDCDDEIPLARQNATGGTERCTFCADVYSKRNGVR